MISLTGTNRDENVMGMGPKVLGVMGGTLELHGERRLSWTKLGATAARGSTQITLDEAPGWRAGGSSSPRPTTTRSRGRRPR
jgi:cell migration-inducing and hyaluronan-binding protein